MVFENVMVECQLTVLNQMVLEFYYEVYLFNKMKIKECSFFVSILTYRLVLTMNIEYRFDHFPEKE